LAKAIWGGVKAMLTNTGACTNEEMFWKAFTAVCGAESRLEEQYLVDFYQDEFQQIKNVCGFDKTAADVVIQLTQMGFRVILATNPLFPAVATESRVRWAGLSPETFEYISTFENSHYSKPNPAYYKEIMDKVGKLCNGTKLKLRFQLVFTKDRRVSRPFSRNIYTFGIQTQIFKNDYYNYTLGGAYI